MGKYGRAREATDDSMAHAHCMLVPEAIGTHSEYVIQSECLLPRTGTQIYVTVFG